MFPPFKILEKLPDKSKETRFFGNLRKLHFFRKYVYLAFGASKYIFFHGKFGGSESFDKLLS